MTVTSWQEPGFPGDAFLLEPDGAAPGDESLPASVDPARLRPFSAFSLRPTPHVSWSCSGVSGTASPVDPVRR